MIDRTPPQNIDAERALLGAMMLNKDAVYAAMEIIGRNTETFYIEAHGVIYGAMMDLVDRNQPVDSVLLVSELSGNKPYENQGGVNYLAELQNAVPTSANAGLYADRIMDAYRLRRIADITAKAHRQAFAGDDWREITADIERGVYGVMEGERSDTTAAIQPIAAAAMEDMLRESPDGIRGLATGVRSLDEITGGLRPSEMIVLAARPSVGKTAMALNIVANVCRRGKTAYFFSLEMAKEQLGQRLLCAVGGVDHTALRLNSYRRVNAQRVSEAYEEVRSWALTIDDRASMPMLELKAKAMRQAARQSLDLVVIDYLQLVSPPRRGENRQVEVAAISAQIKQLARELRCPVLALSQLSRGPEARESGKPKLSDLRESGAIEQDSDVVILMAKGQDKNSIDCAVAKQRNGPTGEFKLTYLRETQRFGEVGTPGYEPTPERNFNPPPEPEPAWQNHDDYDDDEELF